MIYSTGVQDGFNNIEPRLNNEKNTTLLEDNKLNSNNLFESLISEKPSQENSFSEKHIANTDQNLLAYIFYKKNLEEATNSAVLFPEELIKEIQDNNANISLLENAVFSDNIEDVLYQDTQEETLLEEKRQDFYDEPVAQVSNYTRTTVEIEVFLDGSFKQFGLGNLEQIISHSLNPMVDRKLELNAPIFNIPEGRLNQTTNQATFSKNVKTVENFNKFSNNIAESEVRQRSKKESQDTSEKRLNDIKTSEWLDFLRRLSIVSLNEKTTLYLRDYFISEQDRNQLLEELNQTIKGEWKISRIVVNGKPLSQKAGGR